MDEELFDCSICGTTFENYFLLVEHKENDHPKSNKTKKIECPVDPLIDISAKESYVDEESNNYHEASKSRYFKSPKQLEVFICIHCNKKYSSRGSMKWHMKKHSDKFFSCKNCNYKTPYKATFQNHMVSVHKTVRDVKCEQCFESFKNYKSMRKHVRRWHLDCLDG